MKDAKIRAIYKNPDDNNNPKMITIVSSAKVARIKVEDIELVEKEGRVIHIVTADKDYSVYESMDTISFILQEARFYRALKSLIINFDHVKDIGKEFINFDSGQSAALGHNNLAKARNAFKEYLLRYPDYKPEIEELRVAEKTQKMLKKT